MYFDQNISPVEILSPYKTPGRIIWPLSLVEVAIYMSGVHFCPSPWPQNSCQVADDMLPELVHLVLPIAKLSQKSSHLQQQKPKIQTYQKMKVQCLACIQVNVWYQHTILIMISKNLQIVSQDKSYIDPNDFRQDINQEIPLDHIYNAMCGVGEKW